MSLPVTLSTDPLVLDRLHELGLQEALSAIASPTGEWSLCLYEDQLALQATGEDSGWRQGPPLFIATHSGPLGFRLPRARQEAVVKAVRGKRNPSETVIDATAGMGQDGFLMAAAGLEVTLIEANPWVHALLADALYRMDTAPDLAELRARLTLRPGQAQDHLPALSAHTVYLDPMFPPRQKSAKVGKAMQIFHQVVGPPTGEAELLAAARAAAERRVVVKRPNRAPYLAGATPSGSVQLKKARFDIYPA